MHGFWKSILYVLLCSPVKNRNYLQSSLPPSQRNAMAFVYRVFQKADMQKGKEFVSFRVLTWLSNKRHLYSKGLQKFNSLSSMKYLHLVEKQMFFKIANTRRSEFYLLSDSCMTV